MRNKGIIRVFAISMAVVCLYQLVFTWKTYTVEKEARAYSGGDYNAETRYLDSLSTTVVYNFLGLRKYTYQECKERELNLGLDLKGGMNVILEISVSDVVKALANYNPDPTFQQALVKAGQMQQASQDDFITLFGRAFREIDPNARLAAIFRTNELGDKVGFDASNEEVLRVLRSESGSAIDNAFNIIRTRIDRFGVVQPNIQQLETQMGRILVELPGVKEPERVRKLLQGSANLEFWETYENSEIYPHLTQANDRIKELESAQSSASVSEIQSPASQEEVQPAVEQSDSTEHDLLEQLAQDGTSPTDSTELQTDDRKDYPLFSVLNPHIEGNQLVSGSIIGLSLIKDTAKVNRYLSMSQIRALFPKNVRFLWSVKPRQIKDPNTNREIDLCELHAIKETGRDGRPPLDGGAITSASADFNQYGGSSAQVSMSMNREGAQIWARMTKENIDRCIAIVLDDNVYSAPRVNQEITGGNSQITGNFTINEATDLANILRSGKLPARAHIIQDEVVGPTLGQESIRAGIISFIMAFVVVLLYLAFYYSSGGVVADIALLVNMFFLMGVLASLGAVLTLPGIAGIILTMGMANDANIIIFERIREELRAGKGLRLAVSDGYKNAYSAIIDGNVTTFLTGLVLFFFGTGPIQGFATTLVLGVLTSLFCSIFISRLIFEWMLGRGKEEAIKFSIPATANVFVHASFNFIDSRKRFYLLSGSVIVLCLLSIVFQKFNYGIDFTGGRSYIVRFDQPVSTVDLQSSLRDVFDNNAPEVKTIGSNDQVRISTDFLKAEENDPEYTANIDSIVEARLFDGCKELLPAGTDIEKFRSDNLLNSQKVGASIADDIKRNAVIAVLLALLVIFLYIFVRFKNWQFGLSAVISLAHNATIMLGLYSLLYKIVPFSLEIDQQAIAAILTIIGYSINDTVIIFDRIREYVGLYPKRSMKEQYNSAINSTLGRTLNTSMSTGFVLLVIFLFGGEMIRGFSFSLLIGIIVGTYSSVCCAAPLVFDFMTRKMNKSAQKR
jgi:SecD/SecF fusion protein